MGFSGTILYVADVRRTMNFYIEAFGLKERFLTEDGAYGDLDTGEFTLGFASLEQSRRNFDGGVAPTDDSSRPPAFELAFEADDVQAAYDRAIEAGASPVVAPVDKPWGQTVAFVRDPDGHLVEIGSPWSPD